MKNVFYFSLRLQISMSFFWQSLEVQHFERCTHFQPLSLCRVDVSFQRKAILRILRLWDVYSMSLFPIYCWFSVSRNSKQIKIKIKTGQQIKSRIWEMKEGKYAKTLAKIQVTAINNFINVSNTFQPRRKKPSTNRGHIK